MQSGLFRARADVPACVRAFRGIPLVSRILEAMGHVTQGATRRPARTMAATVLNNTSCFAGCFLRKHVAGIFAMGAPPQGHYKLVLTDSPTLKR